MSEDTTKNVEFFIQLYNKNLQNLLARRFNPHKEQLVIEWFKDKGEPTRVNLEIEHPEYAHKFINPFDKAGKQ